MTAGGTGMMDGGRAGSARGELRAEDRIIKERLRLRIIRLFLDATHRVAVSTAETAHARVATAEVQVPRGGTIDRRRPTAAEGTTIERTAIAEVATTGGGEEYHWTAGGTGAACAVEVTSFKILSGTVHRTGCN